MIYDIYICLSVCVCVDHFRLMRRMLERSVTYNSAIPKDLLKPLGIVELCVTLCSNIGQDA